MPITRLNHMDEHAYDYGLDFYYNASNIPNQDLVFATIEYFETGPRKGYYVPLEFLNLVYRQYDYINNNVATPFSVLEHLKSLPLDAERQHILFGFILKWFGGYPVENMNPQYNTTLRLIEQVFLAFPSNSPEKQFCQKDWVAYKRMRQFENMISDRINSVNTGLEVSSQAKAVDQKALFEKVDERFLLSDVEEDPVAKHEYEKFQREIARNGYMGVTRDQTFARIYHPALAYLLCTQKLAVTRTTSQEKLTIDPSQYMDSFLDGFTAGQQYVSREFAISPGIIYGPNAKNYVDDLHMHYYHTELRPNVSGWVYVKTSRPLLINHKIIREYGYYSGIVDWVEKQIKQYPVPFRDFHLHESGENDIEAAEPGISLRTVNKLYDGFFGAYYSIYVQLIGEKFDEEKQRILYTQKLDSQFIDSFQHILLNNIANKEGLNTYIKEVYYNKIVHLVVLFKTLSTLRASQLGGSGKAVEDSTFLLIENGYLGTLRHLCGQIRTSVTKHRLDPLALATEISLNDYNISGEYLALLREPALSRKDTQKITPEHLFTKPDWEQYITALTLTTPPLISAEMKFIGSKSKHKGVLCSWFKHLQNKGIISSAFNRRTLAGAMNKLFQDFNMGTDGKTFDNISKEYDHNFHAQLEKLCPAAYRGKDG
jgi:hypothetical protein